MTPSLTIRIAYPDDRAALERLATLDARPLPSEPLLVAEVDGELWAVRRPPPVSTPLPSHPLHRPLYYALLSEAVGLADGGTVADPFRPSGALVGLLHARRLQLAEPARKARLARMSAKLRFA